MCLITELEDVFNEHVATLNEPHAEGILFYYFFGWKLSEISTSL